MRSHTQRMAGVLHPAARVATSLRRPGGLIVLGWHRIDTYGGGVSTRTDVFERQLDALEEWRAVVLGLEQALTLQEAGQLPDRAVVLTFDDGYASIIEQAWPMLRKRQFPATMFVCSEYLDASLHFDWDAGGASDPRARLADADAVRDVHRDGLAIGSHTATHPWLPHLSDVAVDRELRGSRQRLEDLLARRVDTLAYPMGGWSPRIVAAARAAGYGAAVTTERGLNVATRDPLALRRSLVPDSVPDMRRVLDGAYTWLRPLDRWRTRNGPAW